MSTWEDDDVRVRQLVKGGINLNAKHAVVGADDAALLADEGDVNVRNSLQNLIGAKAVERGELGEQGNGGQQAHASILPARGTAGETDGSGDRFVLVDVRIGVTQAPREIAIELADDVDRDDLKARIEAALGGATDVLSVVDKRGNESFVPAAKIAYVELGSPEDTRRIGFGN